MMGLETIPWADLAPFIVVGFFAQLVDGTLGLGFGVLSNTLLIALGVPPPAASAAVRTSESFASGFSGLAHIAQRNVDWRLFARLVVPGVAGGVIGVWIFALVHQPVLRPVMFAYLAAVGTYLLWRGPRRPHTYRRLRLVGSVGLIGGFLDASGGGGWGPVVTGHLLAQGATPRVAIGTANAAEFFVTVTVLAAFIRTLGFEAFTIAAAGLLIGGVAAAPLGALLVRQVSPRLLVMLVGGLLIATALYGLLALVFGPIPAFPRY